MPVMVTAKLLGMGLLLCSAIIFAYAVYTGAANSSRGFLFVSCMFALFGFSTFVRSGSNPEVLEDNYVVITDCASQTIGFYLAKTLLTYGVHVFACINESNDKNPPANSPESELKQLQEKNDRLHILRTDFSNDESIRKLVDYVDIKLGNKFLYAVINTHGQFYSGAIETTPVNVFEKLFNVNILNTVRIVKAFSQMLRDGKGRFINFSSAEGRLAYPFYGAFTTTRFALEGLTDTLRTEMRQLDVKVVLIEPCDFRASIGTKYAAQDVDETFEDMWQKVDDEVKENYGFGYYSSVKKCILNKIRGPTSDKHVIKVIDASLDALASDIPKDRYLVGAGMRFWNSVFDTNISKLLVLCSQFLPATVIDLWFDLRYMRQLQRPNYLKKK